MDLLSQHPTLILGAEQSLRIERRAPVRLCCLSGLLWITQEGDRRDFFAARGDAVELPAGGVILVTALENSVVTASEARATGLLARLLSGSA